MPIAPFPEPRLSDPIRPAALGDYDDLCELFAEIEALHARLLPSFFRRPAAPPLSRVELVRLLEARDQRLLVAEDLRSSAPRPPVVGVIHVVLYDTPPRPSLTPRRRAQIDTLVVVGLARRLGLGTLLVERGAAWARGRGADEMVLTVWAGNDAAVAFYERHGFREVNRVLALPLE